MTENWLASSPTRIETCTKTYQRRGVRGWRWGRVGKGGVGEEDAFTAYIYVTDGKM